MVKKGLKIFATLLIGGVFLWLAFRNVDLSEIWAYTRKIAFGWIPAFILAAFVSHYLRAERWKLLIETEGQSLDRYTLFSGVMAGYLMNLVAPRLGEITRPVYVARKEGLSSSRLMGTIVLERVIDIATMGLLMLLVAFYLVSDPSLLSQIFGDRTVELLKSGTELKGIAVILAVCLLGAGAAYAGWKLLLLLGRTFSWLNKVVERIRRLIRLFVEGLMSAKDVKRWWLFLLFTLLIWVGYTFMTFIPFWMFDMQSAFGLSFLDAFVITVISAIGIAIPSPGGLGTYHYFVKQTLLILFAVPAVTGLAYATITHAAMVLLVVSSTPVILAVDKFRSMKREGREEVRSEK